MNALYSQTSPSISTKSDTKPTTIITRISAYSNNITNGQH